jgi:hypothetical protein
MSEVEDKKEVRVTEALTAIEQMFASQRNYNVAAVLKASVDYVLQLEAKVALAEETEKAADAIMEAA